MIQIIREERIMDIGHKIFQIRKEHGLSQEQFAQKFHVTRQTVSNWENNRNYPDMDSLRQISDEFGVSFDMLLKEDEELIQRIDSTKKTAKRVKWAAIALALIAAFACAFAFFPKAISLLYYDPGEIVVKGDEFETSRMTLDSQVYNELFIPLRRFDSVTSVPRGAGRYDIVMSKNISYADEGFKQIAGEMERNRLILYDRNLLRLPAGNTFEWTTGSKDIHKNLTEIAAFENKKENGSRFTAMAGEPDFAREELRRLDPRKSYFGYISLNRVTDYEKAVKWVNQYECGTVWAGIITDNEHNEINGMYVGGSGIGTNYDYRKYPHLRAYDSESEEFLDMDEEKLAKQHFLSMLRYMRDQETFANMYTAGLTGYDVTYYGAEYFDSRISYIKNHGMKVHGFAVVADRKTLLKMSEDKRVFSVGTEAFY